MEERKQQRQKLLRDLTTVIQPTNYAAFNVEARSCLQAFLVEDIVQLVIQFCKTVLGITPDKYAQQLYAIDVFNDRICRFGVPLPPPFSGRTHPSVLQLDGRISVVICGYILTLEHDVWVQQADIGLLLHHHVERGDNNSHQEVLGSIKLPSSESHQHKNTILGLHCRTDTCSKLRVSDAFALPVPDVVAPEILQLIDVDWPGLWTDPRPTCRANGIQLDGVSYLHYITRNSTELFAIVGGRHLLQCQGIGDGGTKSTASSWIYLGRRLDAMEFIPDNIVIPAQLPNKPYVLMAVVRYSYSPQKPRQLLLYKFDLRNQSWSPKPVIHEGPLIDLLIAGHMSMAQVSDTKLVAVSGANRFYSGLSCILVLSLVTDNDHRSCGTVPSPSAVREELLCGNTASLESNNEYRLGDVRSIVL